MVLSKCVLALLLFVRSRSLNCPVAECYALNENLCGMRRDGKLLVNSNPCPVATACSIGELLAWWEHSSEEQSYCGPSPLPMTNTTLPPVECEAFREGRNFKSGMGHVDCEVDQDCLLQDDSFSTGSCQCSLRVSGMGICMPDVHNQIFLNYWDDCSGDVLQGIELEYWSFYISQWAFLQADLPCTSYFQEIDVFTTIFIAYMDSAASVLAACSVLLLLAS